MDAWKLGETIVQRFRRWNKNSRAMSVKKDYWIEFLVHDCMYWHIQRLETSATIITPFRTQLFRSSSILHLYGSCTSTDESNISLAFAERKLTRAGFTHALLQLNNSRADALMLPVSHPESRHLSHTSPNFPLLYYAICMMTACHKSRNRF